jgi:hypothetical protein
MTCMRCYGAVLAGYTGSHYYGYGNTGTQGRKVWYDHFMQCNTTVSICSLCRLQRARPMPSRAWRWWRCVPPLMPRRTLCTRVCLQICPDEPTPSRQVSTGHERGGPGRAWHIAVDENYVRISHLLIEATW